MKESNKFWNAIVIVLIAITCWYTGLLSYRFIFRELKVTEMYGYYLIENDGAIIQDRWYVENGDLKELENFLKEEYEIPVQRTTETRWDIPKDEE